MRGVAVGDELLVISWLHQGHREVLEVHPRNDRRKRLWGVFATRSPDRPNPLGLHPVTVLEITGNRLKIEPIEVIDGTPVVDIKPVLKCLDANPQKLPAGHSSLRTENGRRSAYNAVRPGSCHCHFEESRMSHCHD